MNYKGMIPGDDNTSNTTFGLMSMVVLPISMFIQLIHMALLLRVMAKEGPIWRKPINWMILTDEAIRFLGSVGSIHFIFVFLMQPDLEGKGLPIDCSQYCCVYVFFSTLGRFWTIIGGTGFIA